MYQLQNTVYLLERREEGKLIQKDYKDGFNI